MDGMLFDIEALSMEDIGVVLKELNVNCQACRLSFLHPHNKGLLVRGNPQARIGVLAEAPGDTETELGQPLVGKSGKEWDLWAKAIGLDTNKDCFHTNVIQCFIGDTLVRAADIKAIYRRFYSGRGIRIVFEGDALTTTPNHPILTCRGWVAANELRKGDYLIHDNLIRDMFSVCPNEHSVPTKFSEIFNTLAMKYPPIRIVSSSDDFHGDGLDGYVDVIRTDGELRENFNTTSPKSSSKFSFVSANKLSRTLSSFRASFGTFLLAFKRLRLSTAGLVGFLRKTFPIRNGSLSIPDFVPLGNSPHGDASPTKFPHNSLITDTSFFGKFGETGTSQVSVRQVVEVQEVEISEHVYNLSTKSEHYSANGIITHNCQPGKVEKEGRMQQEAPDKDEIKACWVPRGLRVLKAMPNLEVVITLGWVAA